MEIFETHLFLERKCLLSKRSNRVDPTNSVLREQQDSRNATDTSF